MSHMYMYIYIYIPCASTTILCLVFCSRPNFDTSTELCLQVAGVLALEWEQSSHPSNHS